MNQREQGRGANYQYGVKRRDFKSVRSFTTDGGVGEPRQNFGAELLLRAVSRLPEDELRAGLARLVASELVFERGTPPEAIYAFKHALVQDAAHGSLLRQAAHCDCRFTRR
jgi:hypothetical protein